MGRVPRREQYWRIHWGRIQERRRWRSLQDVRGDTIRSVSRTYVPVIGLPGSAMEYMRAYNRLSHYSTLVATITCLHDDGKANTSTEHLTSFLSSSRLLQVRFSYTYYGRSLPARENQTLRGCDMACCVCLLLPLVLPFAPNFLTTLPESLSRNPSDEP